MALKKTQFITTKFDRCEDAFGYKLPEGHIVFSQCLIDTPEGLELDRNDVFVEVQHGTLKDIAEEMGVEFHPAEDN